MGDGEGTLMRNKCLGSDGHARPLIPSNLRDSDCAASLPPRVQARDVLPHLRSEALIDGGRRNLVTFFCTTGA